MRVFFTFLLALFWLVPSTFSQGWKSSQPPSPRPIECGQTERFSTWGQDNDFSGADYADCLPNSGDAYEGNDVMYTFTIDEVSDIRFTIESQCAKGLFLFQEIDGGMKCLDADELDPSLFGATKGFFGGMRVNPGTYFLVIDERLSSMCEMFTLTFECKTYEPYTICELGGQVTSCGKTISSTLPPSENPTPPMGETPPNLDIQAVPCTPINSFQIYQGYFKNPGTIIAELSEIEGGKIFIIPENAACDANAICENQLADNPAIGINSLNNAPGGFYYFVVVGTAGQSFDFKVTTNDCICDYTAEMIECGQSVTADAGTEQNKFDNVLAQGLNAYENCYGRERPYTGGDKVYQFEVDEETAVTINLQSLFNAGVFLFDANCADDCLAYDETFGLNGTAAITDFVVGCGVYQIIVDLEKSHAASCPFTLELTSCKPDEDIEPDKFIATGKLHFIDIVKNLPYNDSLLKGDDGNIITFYATDRNDCKNIPSNQFGEIQETVVFDEVNGNNLELPKKNGYEVEEGFRVQLTLGDLNQGFVETAFGEGEFTKFIETELSTLSETSKLDARPGIANMLDTRPIDRIVSSDGGEVTYAIFTNQSTKLSELDVAWCVSSDTEGAFAEFIPDTGSGTDSVRVIYEANTIGQLRRIKFTVTGIEINQNKEFYISQRGFSDCKDDTTPPSIISCPSTDTFEVASINSLIRLRAELLGMINLEATDICTAPEDLIIQFSFAPTQLNATPQMIEFSIKDGSENESFCPIWVKLSVDPTNGRLAQLATPSLQKEDNFTIYPNPNNGTFTINLPMIESDKQMISIYNTFGQKVREITQAHLASNQTQSIKIDDLETGIYLVKINSRTQEYSKKIMVLKN